MNEDSSAAERPERRATKPAIMNDRITAGPAIPDATPIRTKIPVPIIAPMPIPVAPQKPRERFNSVILISPLC